MVDKSTVDDKTISDKKPKALDLATKAGLGSLTLAECKEVNAAACKHTASVPDVKLVGDPNQKTAREGEASVGQATGNDTGIYRGEGMAVKPKETLERSPAQIRNVETVLKESPEASDKLKAAGVLAANGEKELTSADGTRYKFSLDREHNVTLTATDKSGKSVTTNGKLTGDGNELVPNGSTQSGKTDQGQNQDKTNESSKDKSQVAPELLPEKKKTSLDVLFDSTKSQEEKLKAAQDMAHHGQQRFKGPDGKMYDIATKRYGARESVTVFQNDGKGHTRVILRGIVDGDGQVHKQKDNHGKDVEYGNPWARKHDGGNGLVRHDEHSKDQEREQRVKQKDDEKPKDQQGKEQQGKDQQGKEQQGKDQQGKEQQGNDQQGKEQDHQQVGSDQGNRATDGSGDKKLEGSPENQKRLDDAREKLKADAQEHIHSVHDREQFLRDMDDFEKRAKTRPLSAKEIAGTYEQLSQLISTKDGAVPKDDRILAAETFAHHMADPANGIDQGHHNTCNVTTLTEHLITKSPAAAAEMMTTIALTGGWKAPDGKQIKIEPGSLIPGVEERNNPPEDGKRSFATQLLNLGLANDVLQRRMPPMFYSQERPSGQGDTGERLRFQDGTAVTEDDQQHNGDKTPKQSPMIYVSDISDEGTRMNGDKGFVIANPKSDNSDGLVKVESARDLGEKLADLKRSGKLPAIIFVDANNTMFEGADPKDKAGWHVVSITDYDEATGKVHISNQWGRRNNIDVSLDDMYSATLEHRQA